MYLWPRFLRWFYTMKRIQFLISISGLLVSQWLPLVGWAQTKPMFSSTVEAVSFEGTVVDAATRQPLPKTTLSVKDQTGRIVASQRIGGTGTFRVNLGPSRSYTATFQSDGYDALDEQLSFTSVHVNRLSKLIRLSRAGAKPAQNQSGPDGLPKAAGPVPAETLGQSTVLASASGAPAGPTGRQLTPPKTLDAKVVYTPPLIVAPTGKTTQLRAIGFVQSKAELLPDAQPALEQLLAFLNMHPTVEIELAGHTDNQGDFDDNVRLSKQRVDLVKAYLVQNGIAAGRITTHGYGPTRPLATNNYEDGRRQNRRVEMIVVKQ